MPSGPIVTDKSRRGLQPAVAPFLLRRWDDDPTLPDGIGPHRPWDPPDAPRVPHRPSERPDADSDPDLFPIPDPVPIPLPDPAEAD
jgi:hypothetical protein